MGERLLANYCSQVLANIKPANLFTVSNSSYDIDKLVYQWNKDYNRYDIYFKIIAVRKKATSIFCYRKSSLIECINDCDTKCFLRACGYDTEKLDGCLECMAKKFKSEDFPHEVGLLLGYPYEDVMGFIDHQGRDYLISGYWKVYYNEEKKCKIFELYNKTRLTYCESLDKGLMLADLISK